MNHMEHIDEIEMELPRWITVPLCDRTITTEVSGDCILPDYQPEIRRLLSVSPTILPPAKYISGGNAEFNGTVDYRILYVGADGNLHSTSMSSEYSLRAPLESMERIDVNEGVCAFATTVGESVSARVSAPRRLNIRCRLRSHAYAYGKMPLEEQSKGSVPQDSIRRLWSESSVMSAVGGLSEPIHVSEELVGLGEGLRVISAEAVPFLQELRPTEGEIRVSGELLLKLLAEREGMGVETLSRKLPFHTTVELEDIDADHCCRVWGTVGELSVKAGENGISCEAELLLEARAMKNLPIRYTADLYSVTTQSACEYAEYALPVVWRCENVNLSQSERLSAEELNLDENTQVIDAWGGASIESCEEHEGRYVLTGQSRYSLLCERDGEYSVSELALPFRYETERGEGRLSGFDAQASVLSCRVRKEGGVLSLDAELAVNAELLGSETIRVVETAEFGEALASPRSGMTIYYTAEDDTLWSVAKKYHVASERLTAKQGKAPYYYF